MVRGNPSNRNPLAQSGSWIRSLTSPISPAGLAYGRAVSRAQWDNQRPANPRQYEAKPWGCQDIAEVGIVGVGQGNVDFGQFLGVVFERFTLLGHLLHNVPEQSLGPGSFAQRQFAVAKQLAGLVPVIQSIVVALLYVFGFQCLQDVQQAAMRSALLPASSPWW
jgi:hypothetical protein